MQIDELPQTLVASNHKWKIGQIFWPSQNIRTLFGQHAHSLAETRPVFVPSGSKKHGQPVLTPPILTPGIKDINSQVLHTIYKLI